MLAIAEFESRLPGSLLRQFQSLTSPAAVQAYLDSLPYRAEELDRSPLRVMTDGQAHCLDGGIFGALALGRLGHRPLILDLQPEPGKDDDHVLALFQCKGAWGAVAKSNYPCLRFREPVYRTLRELAMTYFEFFFSVEGEKTLRGYTRPFDLSVIDPDWMWSEAGIANLTRRFYSLKSIRLIQPESIPILSPVDERTYQAGTVGTDMKWSFGIRENK
jgi:hypothetical protein